MDEETRATIGRLHTILRPYLLRRLKADVEKQMPGKYEHIIKCRMSKRQRFLYDEFMSRAQTKDTLSSGNFLSIINCLMQLRKVCNHPDLFEVRPVVTSFAMPKSVLHKFDATERIVRKQFADSDTPSYPIILERESDSIIASYESRRLNKPDSLRERLLSLYIPPRSEASIDVRTRPGWQAYLKQKYYERAQMRIDRQTKLNEQRCATKPVLGSELRSSVKVKSALTPPSFNASLDERFQHDMLRHLHFDYAQRSKAMSGAINRFAFATPNALTSDLP